MANQPNQFWATVGGQHHWWRSKFEWRWAQYLERLKTAREVDGWLYESERFEFKGIRSGTVFYLPDFWVIYRSGDTLWHETKGHLTQRDITKFRRMAKYHPAERIVLVMQNIPKSRTKKNARKRELLKKAQQYVERIIDGTEQLKKVGL